VGNCRPHTEDEDHDIERLKVKVTVKQALKAKRRVGV
jgi:hypothetical protein